MKLLEVERDTCPSAP